VNVLIDFWLQVLGFASRSAAEDYMLANPESTLGAVHFNVDSSGIKYIIQTNTTVSALCLVFVAADLADDTAAVSGRDCSSNHHVVHDTCSTTHCHTVAAYCLSCFLCCFCC
jgi:hypothetical protein